MSKPQAAVLVSTYERPGHLYRSLVSIAAQRGVCGQFEVVVTDDGSRDETVPMVERFARSVDFPVRWTTHDHTGFRLATCRNEGVASSTAPYLIFLDGDLLVPPDFIAKQLARRIPHVAMAGDSCYLDRETTARISEVEIRSGKFLEWVPPREKRRLARKAFRARLYNWIRHPTCPRLKGGNIAMGREDYERVNGYDENFMGWGLEETDLQYRLSRCGVRFKSSLDWTTTYHLWHERDPSFMPRAHGTNNERYMHRKGRLTRSRRGLRKRPLSDVAVQVMGMMTENERVIRLLKGRFSGSHRKPEVEILFQPGNGRFSGKAECNVLVVLNHSSSVPRLVRKAHVVASDHSYPGVPEEAKFKLNEFDKALESIV